MKDIHLPGLSAEKLKRLHRKISKAAKKARREAERLPEGSTRRDELLKAAEEGEKNAGKIRIHFFRRDPVKAAAYDKAMKGIQLKMKGIQNDRKAQTEEQVEGPGREDQGKAED